jgi:hypothetical protein
MSKQITHRLNQPVPFAGSTDEAEANWHTHLFASFDGEAPRCLNCDAGSWMRTAEYPCGAEVPRQETITYSDGSREVVPC